MGYTAVQKKGTLTYSVEDEQTRRDRQSTVTKSQELIQRSRYNLTVQEQKILLYVMSKIHSGDTMETIYDIEINQFCKTCGISLGNYDYLKNTIENLRQKTFWIAINDKQKGTGESCVAWFSTIRIFPGDGTVQLRFDPDLLPYLIELKSHFISFPILPMLVMRSKYSIRLYELLKSYSNLDEWTFNLDELKRRLDCESYRYQDFRRRILEDALHEINRFTDLDLTYIPIKTGRQYAYIKFIIDKKAPGSKLLADKEIEKELDGQLSFQ